MEPLNERVPVHDEERDGFGFLYMTQRRRCVISSLSRKPHD
jgi:hypothetical protein